MSTVHVTVTTCDKCGAHAPDDPIIIGIGGVWRELDLCTTHRASFDTRVTVWFALASRVPLTPPAPPRTGRGRTQLAAAGRRRARPDGTALAVAFTDAVGGGK